LDGGGGSLGTTVISTSRALALPREGPSRPVLRDRVDDGHSSLVPC
jgi:hypothetical protein